MDMDNLMSHPRVVFGALGLLAGFPIVAYGLFQGETHVFWAGVGLMVVGFVAGKPPNPEEQLEKRAEEFER